MAKRSYYLILFVLASLLTNVTCPVQLLAQSAVRQSLKLNGAQVRDMVATPDGSMFFLAADGPYGIFYANTLGGEWTLAIGGEYAAGSGRSVAATTTTVYASLTNKLYSAPVSDPTNWTEIVLPNVQNVSVLELHGLFLILGDNDELLAYDGSSVVDRVNLPAVGELRNIAVSEAGGVLFIELGNNLEADYYRITYNAADGSLGDTWTEVTPPAVDSGKFSGLGVDPTGRVYVSTFNAGNGDDGSYRSTDNGTNWTLIAETAGATNGGGISFNGANYIVGNYLSTNSGTSFTAMNALSSESTPLHLSANLALFDPSSANRAYRLADVGIAFTTNLTSGADTWAAANSGLEGVTVTDMAQLPSNKNVVVLATNQLCALTNNFTADEPDWAHPILPGGNDGGGCRGVALDPTNESTVYTAGGASVYSGQINSATTPPTIGNWQTIDTPSEAFTYTGAIETFGDIPTKLFVGYRRTEGAVSGHLAIFDIANAYAKTTPAALNGLAVSAIMAANSSTLFVGVGALGSDASAVRNGIYLSTDGGVTWNEMTDSDVPSTVYVNSFDYDVTLDILYAATENGLLKLTGAASATSTADWQPQQADFDSGAPGLGSVTAVAVDDSTGVLYAAQGKNIYRSADQGASWSTYYEGLDNEQTNVLFFDDLVQGSNTGFFALSDSGLTSPVRTLWNGFLNMTNVLELNNTGETTLTATVALYDIAGTKVSEQSGISIAGRGQFDVIVNGLTGFQANSYGIIEITFSGTLEGRMSFYRGEPGGGANGDNYEFAYAVPLTNPYTGTTNVSFNTFQPSSNPADATNGVANWLSIVNLDSTAKDFTITRYDQSGTSLIEVGYQVNPLARLDIDGGHQIPGAGHVGYNRIVPSDASAPYLAQLVRYGASSDGGYDFAFPLLAKAGGATEQWVSVSSGASAQNWLEVVNVSSEAQSVTVRVYNNAGEQVGAPVLNLSAHGQLHLDASALLGAGATGAAKVESAQAGVAIAQSMYYFRNAAGSIEAMYGKQAGSKSTGSVSGSYNLYLGMYDWFRIFNGNSTAQNVTVSVYNASGTPNTRMVGLGAFGGTDLGLHETSSYGTAPDSYGAVTLEGTGLVSEVLRIKPTNLGTIDFAFPTEVR